jgi:hypothetical protein
MTKDKAKGKAVPTDPVEYAKAVALVKSRVARWPNAYASGQVVIEYKRAMAAKGQVAYEAAGARRKDTALRRWFREEWVDVRTGKKCGNVERSERVERSEHVERNKRVERSERVDVAGHYPVCRPAKRVTKATPVTVGELTPAERKRMVAMKEKAGSATVQYRLHRIAGPS